MRENLFHGKRKDNGEWVEGCLLGSDVIVPKGQPFYICHDILDSALKAYVVIPETVGQHIERKDKNGKKIFEGDILHCTARLDSANMVVIYESAEFRLVLCERYKTYTTGMGYKYFGCLDTEVIGNVYDNPELIGGEANG
ncbi:MAG: YopX family protein [[Eubacterium] siraeum]|jgi:uncharacterized phage protein (TIGR01671 family)|nr:MAG TPA: YopX protein [Caudoviricetes sp.]